MMFLFVLCFVIIAFICGMFVACEYTLDMLRDSVKTKKPFIGKYHITLVSEPEQE